MAYYYNLSQRSEEVSNGPTPPWLALGRSFLVANREENYVTDESNLPFLKTTVSVPASLTILTVGFDIKKSM